MSKKEVREWYFIVEWDDDFPVHTSEVLPWSRLQNVLKGMMKVDNGVVKKITILPYVKNSPTPK